MTRPPASPDDVVLVDGVRTSIGKRGGRWADVPAVELGGRAVRGLLERLDGPPVEQVVLGNVVQAGNGQNPARQAGVRGGVPRTVPALTVNDVCLASMSALSVGVYALRAGDARTVLVGGFESMSRAPGDLLIRDGLWCALDDIGMGPLSDAENARLGIGRPEQDALALESHRRAAAAWDAGRLAEEMVDPEVDEGIRRGSDPARLAALPPAFTSDGTITAASSSQMSDAASAGLLATRASARATRLDALATVVGRAVIAGETSSLHERPAEASEVVLERHGLTVDDIALWEINEAFAGVVLASTRRLGLDLDRVNVNGGAIALGHPLGASAFRLVLTLAHELRRRGAEYGVATLCGGGGLGQAVLVRNEA